MIENLKALRMWPAWISVSPEAEASGHLYGPAGVFRITRTLDTRKLKAILNRTSRK